MNTRKPYLSDVSDEEWALAAPYLTLLPEVAGQREHGLREVFNGLRYILKTGAPWRWMPNDLPPWAAVYQQAQRGWQQGASTHSPTTCAPCCGWRPDARRSRVLPSWTVARCAPPRSPASERVTTAPSAERGSKLHLAVDTLGHLLALHVTAANADERAEVGRLAAAVQEATGDSVSLAYVDQGYTGQRAAAAARAHGMELEVVRLPETKRGFVLLPRRWVVERSFAWATRFRRLVKDYERYASTLADLHVVAFVCLMLKRAAILSLHS